MVSTHLIINSFQFYNELLSPERKFADLCPAEGIDSRPIHLIDVDTAMGDCQLKHETETFC